MLVVRSGHALATAPARARMTIRSCPVIVTAGQTVSYVDIVDWFGPQGGNYPPRPR